MGRYTAVQAGADEGDRNIVHAEERHQAILRRLREHGSLRVSEFANELGMSPITVRRDVETLAGRGLLVRVHGGAVPPQPHAETAGPGQADAAGPERPAPSLVFGMIVPTADYYYPEVIRGAREAAASRGIRLVLGISQYDPAEEHAQARRMLADGIDGLLITPCGGLEDQRWLGGLTVPFAMVERRPEDDAVGAERAVTDHVYGGRLAVRHLVDTGRRRITLLLRQDSPHSSLVAEGYEEGLRAAGLEPPTPEVFRLPAPGDRGPREVRLEAFVDAVAAGTVDAALVHNDHDAIVLLQRLRARGITVPEDLAIVTYDDEVAALADIPLSAIAPPKRAVGAAAVDLLALRLADPARPRHRLAILPELHVRESSG
ncbi:substrate-binding domain-containing protein [Streptomyces candidus]|uniref:DNA-binding LacI/PurR family transcriptional regulator n=1 Tax=Streptomyces candidus TaxID=67283 RepID=A0A7X0HE98_9ACTN|nr:substrate-binding domain-containing protein [Streptomyces candidus]MBB6436015.1 DNA-binding LacI/PurR family transcriptional regulator [Streptomyces candidus]GHH43346.1 LacI family transcriptional regulator [Streptomyces candidus]